MSKCNNYLCPLPQILPQGLDHEEGPNSIDVKVDLEALGIQVTKFVIVLVACHQEEEVNLHRAQNRALSEWCLCNAAYMSCVRSMLLPPLLV